MQDLDDRGWFVCERVVGVELAAELAAVFATVRRPGTRDGLAFAAVRRLAGSAPGTHRDGVLAPDAIAERRARLAAVAPAVPPRGAMVMRPLLLHASSRANAVQHRRIVHLEFAPRELPGTTKFRRGWVEPRDA